MKKTMSEDQHPRSGHNPMRKVLSNFGLLIRGRGVAGIMAFASTALMARTLGPSQFGVVILIQTYALLLNGLSNFRSFDAIVHFGVPIHDAGNTSALRRLFQICRRNDRRASVIAAIVAIVAAPLIGPRMGLQHDDVILLAAYCVVLLMTGTGTAIGILRIYEQLDALGRQMAVGPIVQFSGALIAWWFSAPLYVFVLVWAIAYTTENLYLHWLGRREYHRRLGHDTDHADTKPLDVNEFQGLRHFLWVSYWQSNMDLVPKYASTVLAGALMGSTPAGLMRLAREISGLLGKPALLIRQVVFLDLRRSWHQGSHEFKLVAYRTALLGSAFGFLFVLIAYFFGEQLLAALVSQQYIGAAPLLTMLLLASTMDLTASPLRSASYAIGYASKVLQMYIATTVLYVILFVALTAWLGLIGAGFAACITSAIPLVVMLILISRKNPEPTDSLGEQSSS